MDNITCNCSFPNKDTPVNVNNTETNADIINGIFKSVEPCLKLENIDVKQKNKKKKKNKRCHVSGCKKKLSLIDLEKKCNCNMSFCMKHFQPFNHNCKFDNKTQIKKIIKENNPKCIHAKINRF